MHQRKTITLTKPRASTSEAQPKPAQAKQGKAKQHPVQREFDGQRVCIQAGPALYIGVIEGQIGHMLRLVDAVVIGTHNTVTVPVVLIDGQKIQHAHAAVDGTSQEGVQA